MPQNHRNCQVLSTNKLAFDNTAMESAGSVKHVSSLIYKPPPCKADPVAASGNVNIIDLTRCEVTIIKILKNRNKHGIYFFR